jgi:hypothetical protein
MEEGLGQGRRHDRQALGSAGAQGVDARQFDFQDLLIKEQQGVEGLILDADRNVPVHGQVGQEAFDLGGAYFLGVLREQPILLAWAGAAGIIGLGRAAGLIA